MVRMILLGLATIFTLLFLYGMLKGKDQVEYVEDLDGTEYFLKDLYIVGFALNNTKLFSLRGKLERDLKKNTKLILNHVYYEYYAYVAWAQFLSLALLVLAAGCSVCALFEGTAAILMLVVVILLVAAIWDMSLSKYSDAVKARTAACNAEFANMVSKLSLLLSSGMTLRDAWYLVANGKNGPLYDLMKNACDNMDNGDSEVAAINKFGILTDSIDIKKFTSTMIQGIEKGNRELADSMMNQVTELWAHKRQLALQEGEIAAGKLLIPLALTFVGIIIIIIAAAMQSMMF